MSQIRVLALGLIRDGNRVFVSQGYDPARQLTFYRALGGGVEFGEPSIKALQREFWEELQAPLTDIEYLGCLENIFVYNGKPGHEIIQLYRCRFADPKFYQLESVSFKEGERQKLALWVDVERFLQGELILYPEDCHRYL
ncbi:MAG: NUDIX hydrolase [Gloeomargarita sp. SKYG116]|nr:NUDIX hydrolase [Gloeomargarita sp. SKYG116]MDW8402066.1 NUDIX hydrolase [Gloeomargarita sp. SKYGB_i_bin116]